MRPLSERCALIITTTLLSASVLACARPSIPFIPAPESAVRTEVREASKQIKLYIAASNKYMACTRSAKKHNKMADEMNEVVYLYNELVITYKSRSGTDKAIATR